MKKTFATSILLLLSGLLLCADVVVEQNVITGEADYGTGAGQSFLLPAGQTVSAIQLHIGSVGNGGGTIEVRLWRATGAPGAYFTRMDSQPIATGVLDSSEVSGQPDWFSITLDKSFTNSGKDPVYLVFEIELLTSGSSGWNNYSFSNLNSYSGGHRVYWNGNQYVINDGVDLTFRILDSAVEPILLIKDIRFEKISWHLSYTARAVVTLGESNEDFYYTLLASDDLTLPVHEWEPVDGSLGDGRSLSLYEYFVSPPSERFFVILRESIEN